MLGVGVESIEILVRAVLLDHENLDAGSEHGIDLLGAQFAEPAPLPLEVGSPAHARQCVIA